LSVAQIGEPNSAPEAKTIKAAVIICEGMIDDGLYKSIQRRTQQALDANAQYLIYQISTYGGLVESADSISKYFILDVSKKAHTVAYITTEAISAGALISVSCQDIIMLENTTIGDCAPILIGGSLEGVEREKQESFIRAAFRRAAEANGYPQALLEAMVTRQMEVYRVKSKKSGQYEFFDSDYLPKDANTYDLNNKELIDANDKILTLTASQALEYGIARAVVKDREGALDFLSKRDGVKFDKNVIVLETSWSEELVRWLNSPVVMGILMMVALLGLYIELNTPGVGLPGLVAVICFAIIIGSKYLTGMANWIEVALFVVGLLLLVIEVFILPGFGITGVLGIICILAGLFGMLVKNPPDRLPWPDSPYGWQLFTQGIFGFLIGIVGFGIVAYFLSRFLPKLEFLSGLILTPSAKKEAERLISSTGLPESSDRSVRVGGKGKALTILRPAGKAKFGDFFVDVVAEGDFIDKDSEVEIIEIHGNRVVVKKI
jgi:membrane-bound serine protease (ClpP class)